MLLPTFIIESYLHLYFFHSPDPGHLLGQTGTFPFPET